MNSWIAVSGSRPTSSAHERTNARLKIPPGRRAMSCFSRASRVCIGIFVALAIWRSDSPRRSRAARSVPPKSPDPRCAAIRAGQPHPYVRKRISRCQTSVVPPGPSWPTAYLPRILRKTARSPRYRRRQSLPPRRFDRARCRRSRAPGPQRPGRWRRAPRRRDTRAQTGFGRGRKHRAGNQVIRRWCFSGGFGHLTDGSSDQRKPGGAIDRAWAAGTESPRRWTPSAPQASATSSPLVDDHASACRGSPARGDQRRQRAAVEIAFPHLNEIDASLSRGSTLFDDRLPAPIGDETERHAAGRSDASRGSRDAKTSDKSTNPATRLTPPRPVMAPRTKMVGEQRPDRRPLQHEVVVIPERGPRQRRAAGRLEEKRHVPGGESGSHPRLHLIEAVDAGGDIAELGRVGLQLDAQIARARPPHRPTPVRRPARISMCPSSRWAPAREGAFEPLDCLRQLVTRRDGCGR